MVSLDERLWYLLLGCAIGYAVRFLQDRLRQRKKAKDEGHHPKPLAGDIALLAVVVVTVWAAFSSARATNELEHTQDQITRVTVCNQRFLADTISALNERTTYTRSQAEANVKLQQAQSKFLGVFFVEPPATENQRRLALSRYFESLQEFVTVNSDAVDSLKQRPYPTEDELTSCLGSAEEVVNK